MKKHKNGAKSCGVLLGLAACDDGRLSVSITDVPLDVRRLDGDPINSARVNMEGDGSFPFEIAFLPPGPYTVAFTCEADEDIPDEEDDIAFIRSADVIVTPGQATEHIFQ